MPPRHPDSARDPDLTPAEARLRAEHWTCVLEHADPRYLVALRRFHDQQFGRWRRYFPDLVPPVPRLAPPESPRSWGQYVFVGGDGLRGEIRIRLSLLTGVHPRMRAGPEYAEGRLRFVEDVLLHESVHAYLYEVASHEEESYHGHGPYFADHANLIGADLDLPPVRSGKRRGADATRPSCAQWPHNVRPRALRDPARDYYQGAFKAAGEFDDDVIPSMGNALSTLDQLLAAWRRASRTDRRRFLRMVSPRQRTTA